MQFDVVAIGGGFAGLIGANRCAQLGLRAAVLEKETADRYLCNSRYTTGIAHILFQDMRLPGDKLFEIINQGTEGEADQRLARVFADNSRRAIDWLVDEGGKTIMVNAPTGKSVMLAPPRRFNQGLDWEGRGADFLLRKLEANLNNRGGTFIRGAAVQTLAMSNGTCIGVDASIAGKSERIEAKAVLIADGGFGSNVEMIRKYISPRADRLLIRASHTAMGDGLRMAEEAGAQLKGFGAFYGHPVHRDAITRPGERMLWPFPMIDPVTQVGLVVGAHGKRVADEGRGGIVLANLLAQIDDPLATTLIFDDIVWNSIAKKGPTAGNPMIMSCGATLHQANDLETLATKADICARGLVATVNELNAAIINGSVDSLKPKRSMKPLAAMPIATPPFYAIPICSGITATMGGITIDTECRALRADGSIIPGLFAAGSTVAGLEGGRQMAYLGGLSKAFILGVLAAEGVQRAGEVH
ncbi:MAG: FAD-binding protein [Betaproteobacteria bacterium]|nr:FAD-binding protein [Betaproteobacteria bacterium]